MNKTKFLTGDKVKVIAGSDKGKVSEITKIYPNQNKALVKEVNVVKKHKKPSQQEQGGVAKKELPVDLSNLAILDNNDNVAKVGYKVENNKKVRINKKTGEVLVKEGKK